MFSVYGVAGRLFNGPLDQMRQVSGVKTLSRVRPAAQSPPDTDPDEHSARTSTQQSVAAYAQAQGTAGRRQPLTRVHEVMSRRCITVMQGTMALEAWQSLADQGVGQAPVVDAQGVLVGMLLRADLLRPELLPGPNAHPLAWRAWLAQPVQDLMWTPVPSVQGDADIRHVASVLLDTTLPAIAVVDANGVVVSVVSRSDLLQAMVHDPPLDLWG